MSDTLTKRTVIIYHPVKNQIYTTVEGIGDSSYQLVEAIHCKDAHVSILFREDEELITHEYYGLPYFLEIC